jgi:hypothetical protein
VVVLQELYLVHLDHCLNNISLHSQGKSSQLQERECGKCAREIDGELRLGHWQWAIACSPN